MHKPHHRLAVVVDDGAVAIGMLNDLPELVPVLKDLGAKHAKYGVVAAHYPVVGGAFIKTLQVGLGDKCTEEVAAAYTAMWGIVEATMLQGVQEAEVKRWGGYSIPPPTSDLEKMTVKSQVSAMDWWTNPDAAARGRA